MTARQTNGMETRPGSRAAGAPLDAGDHAGWMNATRVVLQPVAAPSILGLFGFAGATFIVAANLAGWYGDSSSNALLFPFAAAFGGVAQFAAALWSYRARDGLATAMHGMWGSFWIAFGILELLNAIGVVTVPASGPVPELGYWFLALAAITVLGTVAALAENLGLTSVLATLAVGAAFLAIHYLTGGATWETVAGYVLMASAVLAAYVAGALMIAGAWGRTVLPLGEYRKAANVPGGKPTRPLEYELGEPGVKQGQ